jgi:hypothetical protein
MGEMGVEPEIQYQDVNAPGGSRSYSYDNVFSFRPFLVDTVMHIPLAPTTGQDEIQDLNYKVPKVVFKAKGGSGGSTTPPPAGGGGGGGGGGGKPKIRKKASIDHRYHTNQQNKASLDSKIKN